VVCIGRGPGLEASYGYCAGQKQLCCAPSCLGFKIRQTLSAMRPCWVQLGHELLGRLASEPSTDSLCDTNVLIRSAWCDRCKCEFAHFAFVACDVVCKHVSLHSYTTAYSGLPSNNSSSSSKRNNTGTQSLQLLVVMAGERKCKQKSRDFF